MLCFVASDQSILKWKSQEVMKARTMQARRKFIMRRPCQIVSTRITGADGADGAGTVTTFGSFVRSLAAMLSAVTPQISQVLRKTFLPKSMAGNKCSICWNKIAVENPKIINKRIMKISNMLTLVTKIGIDMNLQTNE